MIEGLEIGELLGRGGALLGGGDKSLQVMPCI